MKTLAAILFTLTATAAATQAPPPPPPPPLPPAPGGPARDMPLLPPIGGGSISGKIVTADERQTPVRAAVVTLRTDGFRAGWTFVTDSTGVFTFKQLPAGRFTIGVARPGFPSTSYGAPKPGRPGTSIVLKENGQVGDITVKLPRGAVISGRVLDESGAPVSGARISVGALVMRNGERALGPGGSDMTDDRGAYRVFGLAAGDYVVMADARGFFQTASSVRYSDQEIDAVLKGGADAARPGQTPPPAPKGQEFALTSFYYPSVLSLADASLVHVNSGDERTDVDVRVSYVPAATLSGVLLDPDGKPPTNVIVNLVQNGARFSPSGFGRPSPVDGTFSFSGLTPGRYVISARATTAAGATTTGAMPPLWARADVDVNGAPVTGVRMTLQPGASVSGTILFESPVSHRPAPSNARVALIPVLASGEVAIGVSPATADQAGNFAFAGVPPGRYRVDPQGGPGNLWTMRSAMLNGQDVLDAPFEVSGADLSGLTVTYNDTATEINGSLEDATGRPAPDYYIIVFPADQKYWFVNSRRIKTARPGLDGKYIVRGLPPGAYRIGAVTDVEPNDWFESWFLQQLLPASAEITLGEAERKTFPLKIGG